MPSPSAIVEQGRILLADSAAEQAGVESGTGVAVARMLLPSITLIPRNSSRETAAIQTLACWAGSLTPRISLTSDTLLLEIGSCLRLFGGVDTIVTAAKEGVQSQGFTVEWAVAPTPLGALWLAWARTGTLCLDRTQLHPHLDALPIDVFPNNVATALARFGARTLADVRKLPAAEMARRIGMEALQLLGRAFGEHTDPRADFVFPEQFALSLQLPAAVENAMALLFAARRLISALAGWLAARQMGARKVTLRLRHRQCETLLVLQFANLIADNERFERVLREHLDHLTLQAPVVSLRLEATHVAPLPGRSRTLFNDTSVDQEAIGTLLERLTARLGEAQVYRVVVHDDHRPEHATRHVPLYEKEKSNEQTTLPRPLWLLDPPEFLTEVDGRPYRHGPLKLLTGAERIESGWWDGGEATGDIRRDYFIALSANARWLWIYRECRVPGGWYLHGFFS